MKNVILFLALCVIGSTTKTQTLYRDVLELRANQVGDSILGPSEIIKLPEKEDVTDLLKKYAPPDKDLYDYFSDNPFMRWDTARSKSTEKGVGSINLPFGIGGADVTKIANGIAQFMIKRAKEELTIAFFQRFKKFAEENQEFKVLFPKTTDNLLNLLSYKYPEMLPTLRLGFFEDLQTITLHLDDVLELPRYRELLKNLPELRIAIRSLTIIQQLQTSESHPAELFSQFAALKEWRGEGAGSRLKNIGNTVALADILSQSLRHHPESQADKRAWLTGPEAKVLLTNDTTFRIYMGLVYQLVKLRQIQFEANGDTMNFTEVIRRESDNLLLFENKVNEFILLADKVDKAVEELNTKISNNTKPSNDDYYNYINTSIDIIDYGFDVIKIFNEAFVAKDYVKVIRKCNDLYRNVYRQEYTQAVTNAIDIYSGVRDLVDYRLQETFARPIINRQLTSISQIQQSDRLWLDSLLRRTGISRPDSLAITLALRIIKSSDSLAKFDKFIEGVGRYGIFMASIVNADSAEEVASIIESAVLPVGSSSIKKNSSFNISVQSYLGANRLIHVKNENLNSSWVSKYGISAPIGISFNSGFGKYGSAGLFVSLFDLGAIVDYQIREDSAVTTDGTTIEVFRKDYKIELGQIVSPGVYLTYGFPFNIPLSLGIGGQYGPGLSKIETSNETVLNNPVWRWNVFLAVDIPFFTLKNRSKSYSSTNRKNE